MNPDEAQDKNLSFIIYGDSRSGWRIKEFLLMKKPGRTGKCLFFHFTKHISKARESWVPLIRCAAFLIMEKKNDSGFDMQFTIRQNDPTLILI